jgi:hypothetical protein
MWPLAVDIHGQKLIGNTKYYLEAEDREADIKH